MSTFSHWVTRWPMLAAVLTLAACDVLAPGSHGAPVIATFSAEPASIAANDTSTLSWVVTGRGVTLELTANATTIYAGDDTTFSLEVAPATTTTYVLSAVNAAGRSEAAVSIDVEAATGALTIASLTATTRRASLFELAWSVTGASRIEVSAASSSEPNAPAQLLASLAGDATSYTAPVPASDRQTIRVCAVSGERQRCTTTGLDNIVTRSDDYDPYYLEPDIAGTGPERDVPWPEPEIPGTLRSVIRYAPVGAVIGFAADIDRIELRGVDLLQRTVYHDAHLILGRDVIISAPARGVTLEGVTAWRDGNPPGDPFTYRSRLILIDEGAHVTLERLTMTGGTFIYRGGGIRNDGHLTVLDSTISGHRAWEIGGGIWNTATGTLRIERSVISGNEAVTYPEELEGDANYLIRRDPDGHEIFMDDGTGWGGGLYNSAGGHVTLVDSLVQGNTAEISGGGIYNEAGSETLLINTTVSGNTPSNVVQASSLMMDDASPARSGASERDRLR